MMSVLRVHMSVVVLLYVPITMVTTSVNVRPVTMVMAKTVQVSDYIILHAVEVFIRY